ncbi:MAG: tetratricopeptide repeat protein [Parachlamydiales bacterium]|nr:tetratricopeptide repeat protein [Parachlamydiales bacterium]
MNKKLILILSLFSLFSCCRVEDKLEPKLSFSAKEDLINSLKDPFMPLSEEEKKQDWAKEFIIAKSFAKELDLYRAITNYKRAEILLGEDNVYRKQQLEYSTLLCYYLAKKYEELIEYFERSTLDCVDKSFEPFHDLLIVLYESYFEIKDEEKTQKILELLQKNYPDSEKKIVLSTALLTADIEKIEEISKTPPENQQLLLMLDIYRKQKKSIPTAQALNAFLPGAGYLYIGQTRSAVTAFLLNGLFIYASYEFFRRGWTAAGIITVSFETGWYFGGIYGAGEETKFYNERIFETLATPIMKKEKYFPIFSLRYGF